MNSKQTSKSINEQRKDIVRRAHESMKLQNTQAVRECRRALETLTGKAR